MESHQNLGSCNSFVKKTLEYTIVNDGWKTSIQYNGHLFKREHVILLKRCSSGKTYWYCSKGKCHARIHAIGTLVVDDDGASQRNCDEDMPSTSNSYDNDYLPLLPDLSDCLDDIKKNSLLDTQDIFLKTQVLDNLLSNIHYSQDLSVDNFSTDVDMNSVNDDDLIELTPVML